MDLLENRMSNYERSSRLATYIVSTAAFIVLVGLLLSFVGGCASAGPRSDVAKAAYKADPKQPVGCATLFAEFDGHLNLLDKVNAPDGSGYVFKVSTKDGNKEGILIASVHPVEEWIKAADKQNITLYRIGVCVAGADASIQVNVLSTLDLFKETHI
jgi:hypothetical protein